MHDSHDWAVWLYQQHFYNVLPPILVLEVNLFFKTHMAILYLYHFIGQGHVIISWWHCVIMIKSSYNFAFMCLWICLNVRISVQSTKCSALKKWLHWKKELTYSFSSSIVWHASTQHRMQASRGMAMDIWEKGISEWNLHLIKKG